MSEFDVKKTGIGFCLIEIGEYKEKHEILCRLIAFILHGIRVD